jgi:hypothetical protein
VDITPFVTGSNLLAKIKFASQTANDPNTPRIPQDLGPFITRGTITQALLDDPNSLLRSHISKQNIINTTAIIISTASPPPPQVLPFGGGVDTAVIDAKMLEDRDCFRVLDYDFTNRLIGRNGHNFSVERYDRNL